MARRRTIYALSADDGVVMYVGGTTTTLALRLRGHLKVVNQSTTPVNEWIRSVRLRGGRIKITALISNAGPSDEAAEIARRVALGEPLLNVRAGGRCAPSQRLALKCQADGERHASVADGALPSWAEKVGTSAERGREHSREWLTVQRAIKSALKPIRPREPLHPNAWRDQRAARLAAHQTTHPATEAAA